MCKTGYAFTYSLLKESVANNVINVSLFACDEITLKTYNVNKRRQDIGKNVWESKKYGVRRLIKEFPNKKWSKRGVKGFLKQLRTMGSIEPAPGNGRPRTMSGGVVSRPVSTLKAGTFCTLIIRLLLSK